MPNCPVTSGQDAAIKAIKSKGIRSMGKTGKRILKLLIVLAVAGGILYYFKDDLLGRFTEYKNRKDSTKQIEELIGYTKEARQLQCETTHFWTESGKSINFIPAPKYIYDRERKLTYEQNSTTDISIFQTEDNKKIKYQYSFDSEDVVIWQDENGKDMIPEGGTWKKTEAEELEGSAVASGTSDDISYGYLLSSNRLLAIEQLADEELDGETVQKYKVTLKRRPEYEPMTEEEWEQFLTSFGLTEEDKAKYPEIYQRAKEMNTMPDTEEMYMWVKDQKLLQLQTDCTREFYTEAFFYLSNDESIINDFTEHVCTIQKYKYDEDCDPITLPAEYTE